MCIDDFGERDLVGLGANVGADRLDELVSGHALAGGRHARQAKIGGVGKNGGKQRVFVVAAFARAQVREGVGEPGRPVRFVQDFGDTGPRQNSVEFAGEGKGLRGGARRHRRDMQLSITELDAVELPAQEAVREAL